MQNFYYKHLEDDTYAVMSYEGDEEKVVIPEVYLGKPVTILYDKLFKGHSELKEITIPDCITDLGGWQFDGCLNLKHVKLPEKLRNLWQYAFVRSGIEEITIPEGVVDISPFAFKDCKNLKKVVCADSLKSISSWAFEGCDNLKELVVSENTKVSPKAFQSPED